MLAIRLTRLGAKKQPSYRIIVTKKRYKRNGTYIANLGHYNPLTEPATVVVNQEQFDYWMQHGAQPTPVVKRLVLGIKGTKKRKPKKDTPATETTAFADQTAVTPSEDQSIPSEQPEATGAPEAAPSQVTNDEA